MLTLEECIELAEWQYGGKVKLTDPANKGTLWVHNGEGNPVMHIKWYNPSENFEQLYELEEKLFTVLFPISTNYIIQYHNEIHYWKYSIYIEPEENVFKVLVKGVGATRQLACINAILNGLKERE